MDTMQEQNGTLQQTFHNAWSLVQDKKSLDIMVKVMNNLNVSIVYRGTSSYLEKDTLSTDVPMLMRVPLLPSMSSLLNEPVDFDLNAASSPSPALSASSPTAPMPPASTRSASTLTTTTCTTKALPALEAQKETPTATSSVVTPSDAPVPPAQTSDSPVSASPVPSPPPSPSTSKRQQQPTSSTVTVTTAPSTKRKHSREMLNFKRFKPDCVIKFANLFTRDQVLKQRIRDNITRHSLKSVQDIDLVDTAYIVQTPPMPTDLFPQPALGIDVVAYFNLLNANLVRSSKETTLLRARSNQSFLDFANSLKHLNQHQKYYLQQQLKEAFMKNRRDPDVVDKQFKAAARVIYLYEYFGEAFILCPRFFTKKIFVGPHAEWNAVHSYLEKQKGKPHLLQEIDFAVAGDCNQMDSLCVGTREEI